jgi:hypothetical protein
MKKVSCDVLVIGGNTACAYGCNDYRPIDRKLRAKGYNHKKINKFKNVFNNT